MSDKAELNQNPAEATRDRHEIGSEMSDLYKPENIKTTADITNIANKTAELMAEDFDPSKGEDFTKMKGMLEAIVAKQGSYVKKEEKPGEPGVFDVKFDLADAKSSFRSAEDPNGDKALAAALNQHARGYVSLEVANKTRLNSEIIDSVIGNGDVLVAQNDDELKANIQSRLNLLQISISADVLMDAINASYGLVSSKENPVHLISNLPGYFAGEQATAFVAQEFNMSAQEFKALLSQSEDKLAEIIDSTNQDETTQKNKKAILAAIYAAKTAWQISAVQKGVLQGKPGRYYSAEPLPGKVGVDKQMTTVTEMRQKIEADLQITGTTTVAEGHDVPLTGAAAEAYRKKRAIHEIVKDISQVRAYLDLQLQ